MKRIAVFMLMIALFAVGATAVQISSPTIGDDSEDRVKGVQSTFTVTNNNSVDLTDVSFSFSAGAESSKYTLSVSGPSTISAGDSQTYTINGTIPLDHPGVDSSLKENPIRIGTVKVTGTAGSNTDSATAEVKMQAVNQLRLKKARVDCGRKSESVDDGDKVENLKPGDDCTLEIEIENNFDDDDRDNQRIGDVEFTTIDIKIDSSDSDVDIDEDDEIDDLGPDDEDIMTADIEIEDDARDGTVRIEVEVEARDENGALHGEAFDFRLEIDRLTHDVQIRRIEVSPTSVNNCGAASVKVDVNILNQGKRDEDEAAVEVTVDKFSFADKIENIDISEDDSTAVSFTVPVPESAKEGIARLDVKTYFDSIALSNSGSVELTVLECEEEDDEPIVVKDEQSTSDDKQTSVVVPQAPVTSQGGQAQAAPRRGSSFTDSKAYVALLAVLSVLIAIAIVLLVVFLVRKKSV